MVAGSIAEQVYAELKKNPLLTAQPLCLILGLPWKKYKSYVGKLRCIWRKLPRDKQGLKPLSFHNVHCNVKAPKLVDRGAAVKAGWIQTKAKNHYLLWKEEGLGRLEWHVNGNIRVWIQKPVNRGKALQLLANAFFNTDLIFDIRVFEVFAKSLRFKGATAVFRADMKLPYMKIDMFDSSNGIVIKLGDRSHPDSVEVDFCFPDWGERVERLVQKFVDSLNPKKIEKIDRGEPDVPYRV